MIIKMSNPDILSKTGRDLLPEETVEYFNEIRSINYYNVLNKTLSEYTFAEWYLQLLVDVNTSSVQISDF